MHSIQDKINQLAKTLGKKPSEKSNLNYQEMRQEYTQLANRDIRKLQQLTKQQRIEDIHGRSDLNPNWTFENMQMDEPDVVEAVSIAKSFIAAHSDKNWRDSSAHLMLFYGDYGRGKSHLAGSIAHELINQYEISVLYRQLSSLLEMRFFSYDYQAQDSIGEKFRQTQKELFDVDLLILDEVCVNQSVLKNNAQSWLGNLLRQRLSENKNCILITNHNLQTLEHALGTYCFESLKEYDTYQICFKGPSRRSALVDTSEPNPTPKSGYVPNQVR